MGPGVKKILGLTSGLEDRAAFLRARKRTQEENLGQNNKEARIPLTPTLIHITT